MDVDEISDLNDDSLTINEKKKSDMSLFDSYPFLYPSNFTEQNIPIFKDQNNFYY